MFIKELGTGLRRKVELTGDPPRSGTVPGTAATPGLPAETTSQPAISAPASVTPVAEPGVAGYWPWVSLLLALGWIATVAIWWYRSRRKTIRSSAAQPVARGMNADTGAVRRVCKGNDAAACKAALLQWSKARWHSDPPASLGAIAARVDGDFAATIAPLHPDRAA